MRLFKNFYTWNGLVPLVRDEPRTPPEIRRPRVGESHPALDRRRTPHARPLYTFFMCSGHCLPFHGDLNLICTDKYQVGDDELLSHTMWASPFPHPLRNIRPTPGPILT